MAGLRKALLGAAMAAALAAPAGSAESASLDAAVANFLGADIVDIIAAADRVESFQLDAKTDVIEPAVQGYAVLEKGPNLSVGQVEKIRALIFADSSYLLDTSKRCPFLADAGLVFHAGDRQTSVVLSQSCKLWGFARAAERPKIEDYDPVEAEIKRLVAELFGKP